MTKFWIRDEKGYRFEYSITNLDDYLNLEEIEIENPPKRRIKISPEGLEFIEEDENKEINYDD